jgi:hypothetical protein
MTSDESDIPEFCFNPNYDINITSPSYQTDISTTNYDQTGGNNLSVNSSPPNYSSYDVNSSQRYYNGNQMLNSSLNGQVLNSSLNGQVLNGNQMLNSNLNGQMLNSSGNFNQSSPYLMNWNGSGNFTMEDMVSSTDSFTGTSNDSFTGTMDGIYNINEISGGMSNSNTSVVIDVDENVGTSLNYLPQEVENARSERNKKRALVEGYEEKNGQIETGNGGTTE